MAVTLPYREPTQRRRKSQLVRCKDLVGLLQDFLGSNGRRIDFASSLEERCVFGLTG